MCLCANVVIRINRGSALHEHHTIIFWKSHLGCFDLTNESIYMTECVYSQSTLHTVGIHQDYFLFVQTWEQRCLEKGEERRTGAAAERGEAAFQTTRRSLLPRCQSSQCQIYFQTLGLWNRHHTFRVPRGVPEESRTVRGTHSWNERSWFCNFHYNITPIMIKIKCKYN